MTRTSLSLALMALLAACGDGQPLFDEDPEQTGVGTDGGVPFEPVEPDDVEEPEDVLNAGTISPPLRGALEARGDIVRVEARNPNGGGAASLFSYNGNDDVFVIDGLAFDGLNEYQRFAGRPQSGTIAIYQADANAPDLLNNGNNVSQLVPYFALYDTSDVIIDENGEIVTIDSEGRVIDANGDIVEDGAENLTLRTTFAVVRTGAYRDFGFGTFAYQRAGGFTVPSQGQATFSGDYAGLRVNSTFSVNELEADDLNNGDILTSGDIAIDIDFDDFNGTPGIKGALTNRQAYNQFGEPIETNRDIRTAAGSARAVQLPDLEFVIRGTGETISSSGEIGGNLSNTIIERDGTIREYEAGTYSGILAGDLTDPNDGGEIVGVLVFEAEDSRFRGVITQETGGFIATR